jgi:uncharacterized protein DUF5615
VTFYLDEKLRSRGLDVVSAHEIPGNTQLDDRSQLLYAADASRAIVTCDVADFAELTGEFIAANREHAGIVFGPPSFRTDEFAAIADAVEQVARGYPGGLAGAVVFLKRSSR